MNIILCGMPRSGKTTIGESISEKLGYTFIDTDLLLESQYAAKTGVSLTCRQIFIKEGLTKFRKYEKEALSLLQKLTKHVVSTGGGTLEDQENIAVFKRIGILLYLEVPFDILWKRIELTGIPPYLGTSDPKKKYAILFEKRVPIYEAAADIIINLTDLDIPATIEKVLKSIKEAQRK